MHDLIFVFLNFHQIYCVKKGSNLNVWTVHWDGWTGKMYLFGPENRNRYHLLHKDEPEEYSDIHSCILINAHLQRM